jgi:hypothetical protein
MPGEGHVEIAREVLKRLGTTPANLADHYDQMFGLGYARVVEHADQVLEVEYLNQLSASQEQFVNGMRQRGWSVRLIRK